MSNLEFHPFADGFDADVPVAGNIGDRKDMTSFPQLSDSETVAAGPKRNVFSLSYYQQFFDVDTDQVVKRIINSVLPTNNNYILDFVQPLPDLWGPFWISVTLVFSIGIFGNIAQYIENEGGSGEYGSDFRMVTSVSSLIMCYVTLVPLALFSLLWQRKSDLQYAYTDILCAYGYSLSVYIPVSLLWVLDVNWFRWALILVSVSLSGTVLAKALWPAFKNDSNKLVAYGTIFGVIFLHFMLAFCFKEYYFDPAHPRSNVVPSGHDQSDEPKLPPFSEGNESVPGKVVPKAPKVAESQVLVPEESSNTTSNSKTEKPTMDEKPKENEAVLSTEPPVSTNITRQNEKTEITEITDEKKGNDVESVNANNTQQDKDESLSSNVIKKLDIQSTVPTNVVEAAGNNTSSEG